MMNIIHESMKKTLNEMMSRDYIEKLRNQKNTLSNSELKSLSSKISSNISDKSKEETKELLLKGLFLYSVWYGDEAIQQARKKGIFRYNAWGYEKNHVIEILEILKKFTEYFDYSQKTINYIEQKTSISWIYDFYSEEERILKDSLLKEHKNMISYMSKTGEFSQFPLIKNLLEYLNMTFIRADGTSQKLSNFNKIQSYPAEHIASGISYLIYLSISVVKLECASPNIKKVVKRKKKSIEKLVLSACKVKQVEDWETLIDFLDYNVTTNKNTTMIKTCNILVDSSMWMGHILRSQQEIGVLGAMYGECDKTTEYQIHQWEKFKKNVIDNYEWNSNPNLSVTFYIQNERSLFGAIESEADLFFEERMDVVILSRQLKISVQECLNKQITPCSCIKDIIGFKRYFFIVDQFYRFLSKTKLTRRITKSLVQINKKEELIENLMHFVKNRQKIVELLELFTYKEGEVLDLQYTPLIEIGTEIMFPPSVIVHSKLERNSIAKSRARNSQETNEGIREPLVEVTMKVFQNCSYSYLVIKNKKIKHLQKSSECDIIVISDSYVVIFECKDSMHPANNFELRSSLDNIKKAGDQLDLQKIAFENEKFYKDFCKKNKVEIKNRKILTCILTGNKLFNGIREGSHPVRSIDILAMVLNTGILQSKGNHFYIRETIEFSENELERFLSDNYLLHEIMYNSFVACDNSMKIGDKKLIYQSYGLSEEKFTKGLESTFPVVCQYFTENKNS